MWPWLVPEPELVRAPSWCDDQPHHRFHVRPVRTHLCVTCEELKCRASPFNDPPSFLPTLPRPRHSAAHHLGARYSYDIVSFLVYSPSPLLCRHDGSHSLGGQGLLWFRPSSLVWMDFTRRGTDLPRSTLSPLGCTRPSQPSWQSATLFGGGQSARGVGHP